jgi:hypothetical protein
VRAHIESVKELRGDLLDSLFGGHAVDVVREKFLYGRGLAVAMDGASEHVLRCPRDHFHDALAHLSGPVGDIDGGAGPVGESRKLMRLLRPVSGVL